MVENNFVAVSLLLTLTLVSLGTRHLAVTTPFALGADRLDSQGAIVSGSQPVAQAPRESHARNKSAGRDESQSSQIESKQLKRATSDAPPQEKHEQAIWLLNGVLAAADYISSTEDKILTKVEASTLLWRIDRERAEWVLQSAVHALNELIDHHKQTERGSSIDETNLRRLKFAVLRRVAALDPSLVQELLGRNSTAGPSTAFFPEWTDEARALMLVASEQIQQNPALATQLAQQSLSLGIANWSGFIRELAEQSNAQAEEFVFGLITTLRDSSISPATLRNLGFFVLAQGRSARLQEHFFESLSIRLRRDCVPETPAHELHGDLQIAREMSRRSTKWQPEFDYISQLFEGLIATLRLPSPVLNRKLIDTSLLAAASAADTDHLARSLPSVHALPSSQSRDKAYSNLAAKAALSADLLLSEDIMSKIEDDKTRRETSLLVYGPFVRKAIQEADWPKAREYAFRIPDPLARTLVIENIARALSGSAEKLRKTLVKELYDWALSSLERETPAINLARAFLVLAKSRADEPEQTLGALNSCISVLNKLGTGVHSSSEPIGPAAGTWIRLPNASLSSTEVLDLPQMMSAAFVQLAKRDVTEALATATGLTDQGLRSFAHLAISKSLLEAANTAEAQTHKGKTTKK